jgi:hypothetical protein
MWASWIGRLEVVRTLLQYGAFVGATTVVRDQMMMMTMIAMTIVIINEDRERLM